MDRTVILWQRGTGMMLARLRGHDDFVYSVKFYPDGQMLVSAGEDGIRLWGGRQFQRALAGELQRDPEDLPQPVPQPVSEPPRQKRGSAFEQPELAGGSTWYVPRSGSSAVTPRRQSEVPALSNQDQLTVMKWVKEGMTMDEALAKAEVMSPVQPRGAGTWPKAQSLGPEPKSRTASQKSKSRWWGSSHRTTKSDHSDASDTDTDTAEASYTIPNPAFDESMGFDI